MQVQIEDVSPIEKKLIVEVPWDRVNSVLGEMYRELSKSVQLKGFRKGKVPRSVLQQVYGKRVHAEVAERLIREGFLTAATEHELEAVSEPKVDALPAIKRGQPFSFEAVVEVRGEVVPENYVGMELTQRPLAIADEEVDQAIEALRREHTELMPIEGRDLTARTDVLTVSIEGTIGDESVGPAEIQVDLGENEREALPGLHAALTGIPINAEEHPVELELRTQDHDPDHDEGDHDHDHDHEPRKASLKITIRDARQKHIPELDDDFVQDVERGQTVEDLRQSLRADIEKRKTKQIEGEVRNAALKELVARNQIPVAPALVDRGIQFRFQQLQAMMGMPSQSRQVPDDMRSHLAEAALEDIRGQLLLEAVADKEDLKVADEDVESRLSEIASERDEPVARIRAEYDRDDRLDSLRYQMRQEKVLQFLVERAIVTEAEPEPEPAGEDATSEDATSEDATSEDATKDAETSAQPSDPAAE